MKQVLYKYKFLWLLYIAWVGAGIISQPLAYVIVFASIFIFLIKDRPIELFIGFLFILILSDHRQEMGIDPMNFAKTAKVFYLLAICFYIYKKRKEFDLHNIILKYYAPFFLSVIISLSFAINLQIGIQKTLSYILLFTVIPILFVNVYKEKGKEFIEAIFVFFFLILLSGLVLYLFKPDLVQLLGERYRGVLGNPNGLGLILVQIALLYAVIKEYKLISLDRYEEIILFTLIIISLFLSGSRNGMISIILFVLLIRVFKIHFLAGILSIGIAFYFYNLFTLDPAIIIRYFGLEEYFRVESIESGSGRFIAWEFAWQKIQDYFFLGGGFGQDEQIMRPNYDFLMMLGHHGGVHSSYLSLWMDSGLVGLILYFSSLSVLIWNASKKSKLAWPFFFVILFNITYESWLVGSLNPFTILFLCSLTLLVMKDKFVEQDELGLNDQTQEKKIAQG